MNRNENLYWNDDRKLLYVFPRQSNDPPFCIRGVPLSTRLSFHKRIKPYVIAAWIRLTCNQILYELRNDYESINSVAACSTRTNIMRSR